MLDPNQLLAVQSRAHGFGGARVRYLSARAPMTAMDNQVLVAENRTP